ncbi:uncharacterized protein LOC130894870 [Diorhabda carinulata]|uniref:uncharacterized protein LOC130894870 n=1 Tax=Diorhabda carinulata TaxID=1163345 RepID=UPI0025A1A001|nr:uncharacterized protein LOC130894870 [Diorhabda carinulata]XP_057657868.1 uncharacterized protein LOC130894870 [Diorhabda carinulata]
MQRNIATDYPPSVEDKCKVFRKPNADVEDRLLEKCYVEKYKGDSKPFLIRDASYMYPRDVDCSTMKASYLSPIQNDRSALGVKKSQLLKQFEEEARNEVLQEVDAPIPPGDYVTVYNRYFRKDGFEPDDEFYTRNEDLYKKYPLYSSPPTTYASFKLKQSIGDKPQGITPTIYNNHPFRKCGQFSKPIQEVLDHNLW